MFAADSYPRFRPDALVTTTIVAAFLLVGTLGGLIIAWGKPAVVAVAMGALASVLLLNFPAVAVWAVLVGALIISGPLVFYVPAAAAAPWGFSLLGFFLLGASLMHGGLQRPDGRGPVPGFVLVGFAVVLFGLASIMWSEASLADGLSGIKRHYQYFGLMFAIALIRWREVTVRRWIAFLVFAAFASVPVAIYQRLFLATRLRGGMDSIVGLLELTQIGTGASGTLTFMVLLVGCGMLALWRENLLSLPKALVLFVILLTPVLIGEVNVIFLWLPLALGTLFFDQVRRRPLVFIGGAAATVFALVAFSSIYVLTQQIAHPENQRSANQRLQMILDYNFGETGYFGDSSLNRKTVYSYWASRHGMSNPTETLFGHGLGSATSSAETRSPLALKHRGLNLGLVGASLLLWEVGVVGLVLYMAMLIAAALRALRLSERMPPGRDRALARTLLVGSTLLLSTMVYNDSMFLFASMQVLAAVILGLTAWLDRRANARPAPVRVG